MKDILTLLGSIAPTLATALGGPAAGLAVKALTSGLGLDEGTDKETALAAVSAATPEQLLEIRKVDAEFQVTLKKLDIDLEKLATDDRASARQREVQTGDHLTPRLLALVVSVGFFALLGWLAVKEPPAGSRDVLNILLGGLVTGFSMILAYYFGSSIGSVRKDQLLANASPPQK